MTKKNSLFKLYNLTSYSDNRGDLLVIEDFNDIPIHTKRSYFIYPNKEGSPRGFHAHKKLTQYAVCISGNCKIIFDDGTLQEELMLKSKDTCLEIRPMIWHEMHQFSKDCILMVMADDYYDENDYIRDYTEFKSLLNND